MTHTTPRPTAAARVAQGAGQAGDQPGGGFDSVIEPWPGWWARQGSNLRPLGCKPSALPLSYAPRGRTGRGRPSGQAASAATALRQPSWSRASPGPLTSANCTAPGLVHQERAAQREPGAVVEHPVGLRDLPVRPEVGQQRELVALRVRPGLQGERVVHRDGQDLHVAVLEAGQVVAHRAQLAGADPGERERVEDHQHVAVAAERRERDLLVVLVLEREVGGFAFPPRAPSVELLLGVRSLIVAGRARRRRREPTCRPVRSRSRMSAPRPDRLGRDQPGAGPAVADGGVGRLRQPGGRSRLGDLAGLDVPGAARSSG